jgi:hypothetical protein
MRFTIAEKAADERGNNHFALMKILFSVVFHLQHLVKGPSSSGSLIMPQSPSLAERPVLVEGNIS